MNIKTIIIVITLQFFTITHAQIGGRIGTRCLENFWYYDEEVNECLPLCKVGERHDEDYYCVEIVYIKIGPDYLEDAAKEAYRGIIIMFSIVAFILLTFCFDGEEKPLNRHDLVWRQIEKLQKDNE